MNKDLKEATVELKVKVCSVHGKEKYETITCPIYQPERYLIDHGYSFNAVEGIWYTYNWNTARY